MEQRDEDFRAQLHQRQDCVSIKEGPVSTEVTIETSSKEQIVSSITTASAKSLGLKIGGEAYAVIKASSVMIAVEE